MQRFVGWAAPVVGGGSGARNKQTLAFRGWPPDTLLGFETASPSPLRPVVWGTGGGVASGRVWRVVAPLWWWGVVFDLWIVVASI